MAVIGYDEFISKVVEKIEILLISRNLAQFKKSNFAESNKLDLTKSDLNDKDSNFTKAILFRRDILNFKAKRAFIYSQKASIKAQILHYFKPKYHTQININILDFAISRVFD